MKSSRLMLLFSAAFLFFLTSCGGNGSEEKTTTDSNNMNTTDTTKTMTAPPSTIVTTPQSMIVVTHKVANFAKWQMGYDAHDSARLANGIHNYVIGRGMQDTNMVLVALKVDDMAKAKAFGKDPAVKKAMQKSGVLGTPTMSFVTTVWQDTGMTSTSLRSKTLLNVKDWDAWFKGFMDGKQERMDNGITDRAIAYDADDNKKVSLVTAVSDTAKAFAYYKSDALKKRREAGGVIGEPKRFLFTVVKRY